MFQQLGSAIHWKYRFPNLYSSIQDLVEALRRSATNVTSRKTKTQKGSYRSEGNTCIFSFRFLKTLEQYINVSLYVLMLLAFHYSWNEFHLFPIVHSSVDCSTSSWTGEFLTLSKSWIVHTSCCPKRTTTIGNKNMQFDTKQGLSPP